MARAFQALHHLFSRSQDHLASMVLVCGLLFNPHWANSQSLTADDLEKQIQTYETLSRRAEPLLMEAVLAGRVWLHLGSLYEDAGRCAQSEMAYSHAIRLLKTDPLASRDLARALDDLGTLYMVRGETKLAEQLEQKALTLRQSDKLIADLPRSWYHLATLSLREHRDQKARDYARRAVAQLEAELVVGSDDEINARFVLGLALCRLRQYAEATLVTQKAMEIVKRSYGADDFPTGFGSFLLGYVEWRSGNRAEAQSLMQNGEAVVEKSLGDKHPVTVSLMTQYAHFLRSTHQKTEAEAIERKVKVARERAGGWQGPAALSVASMF